jgi:hypothetical protein
METVCWAERLIGRLARIARERATTGIRDKGELLRARILHGLEGLD